jgi:hypothetical protein
VAVRRQPSIADQEGLERPFANPAVGLGPHRTDGNAGLLVGGAAHERMTAMRNAEPSIDRQLLADGCPSLVLNQSKVAFYFSRVVSMPPNNCCWV